MIFLDGDKWNWYKGLFLEISVQSFLLISARYFVVWQTEPRLILACSVQADKLIPNSSHKSEFSSTNSVQYYHLIAWDALRIRVST